MELLDGVPGLVHAPTYIELVPTIGVWSSPLGNTIYTHLDFTEHRTLHQVHPLRALPRLAPRDGFWAFHVRALAWR